MSADGRVLVVGAGIAGLAAALRLRRSGWDVVVVERASGLRGGGYVLTLSGVGYDGAERMGLVPALRDAQPEPFDLVYVDQFGRQQSRMDAQTQHALLGDRQLGLFRGDIERLLFESLDDAVEFRFGATVDAIDQDTNGVSVRLSDGTAERVAFVVGADGLHSRVRSLMFGPEERYRRDFGDLVAITLLDKVPEAVAPGTGASLSLVGRGMSVLNPPGSQAAAFFMFRSDRPAADLAAGVSATLRRRFGDLGWVVPEVLDTVDGSGPVFFDQISQVRMPTWRAGRVVLLGDSAWCVSLYAGYGASLALGGAALLGEVLDARPGNVPAALRRWEELLRPVAERRSRHGRRLRSLFISSNRVSLGARERLLRLSNNSVATAVTRRFLGVSKASE
ncbi:FAD-dependent monooxygenase [Streptomonospora sediminis]